MKRFKSKNLIYSIIFEKCRVYNTYNKNETIRFNVPFIKLLGLMFHSLNKLRVFWLVLYTISFPDIFQKIYINYDIINPRMFRTGNSVFNNLYQIISSIKERNLYYFCNNCKSSKCCNSSTNRINVNEESILGTFNV